MSYSFSGYCVAIRLKQQLNKIAFDKFVVMYDFVIHAYS